MAEINFTEMENLQQQILDLKRENSELEKRVQDEIAAHVETTKALRRVENNLDVLRQERMRQVSDLNDEIARLNSLVKETQEVLSAPEPDTPLYDNPEATEEWQEWHDDRKNASS